MISKIDWISFSFDMPGNLEDEREAPRAVVASCEHLHPNLPQWLAFEEPFTPRNGRPPYRTTWAREDNALQVYTHPTLPHGLIEISGKGCERLGASGLLSDVLKAVCGRLTRLDIASDMLTITRPLEFAQARTNQRFKSVSHVVSSSGETFYVGARTSDRYCRVYRYNPPHERAHLLRAEHVVKAEQARLTAEAIIAQGLEAVVVGLGKAFGWEHDAWAPGVQEGELRAWRPERREGKTLFWLADTVGPLLARLHSEGVIDVDAWIEEHVRPRIPRPETAL